jgi:hypothetical protein
MARLLAQPFPVLLDMDVEELVWRMGRTAEAIEKYGPAFGLFKGE